ncbi:MAG: ABC transporter ATP-binding protein [Ginsengibacter sp.]
MKISLQNVGKRYNRDWIFRHFSYQFIKGSSYAITGPNGSGKSTLLKIIAGATTHNEGHINYDNVTPEHVYKHISLAAPYLEVIEEMTLREFFEFHERFKSWLPGFTLTDICKTVNLENATNKQIRNFSSGMKQRVKLAIALLSNVQVVLLDEPTTNLDSEGIHLYKQLIKSYSNERLLIISSNTSEEYDFCEHIINMTALKSTLSSAGN